MLSFFVVLTLEINLDFLLLISFFLLKRKFIDHPENKETKQNEEGKFVWRSNKQKNCQIEFPTKHVSEPSSDNKHNVGSNKNKLSWYDREQEQQQKKVQALFVWIQFHHICWNKKNLKNSHDNNCI